MATKDKFQGVDISPVTLKDGSLRAAFDPLTHPGTSGYGAVVKTGTAKVGTTAFGGRGEAQGEGSPDPVDGGGQPYAREGGH